jgi:16S rRNA (guanine527-N7)-methyltransferase
MEPGPRDLLVSGAASLGLRLDEAMVDRFSAYLNLIQTWGARINLTSRLEGGEIVIYHFLDSLSGARWLEGAPGAKIIDLGTGAGLPAIPLKIVRPDLEVVMIDGTGKKIAFCQEVIKALGLVGAEAIWGRAEELGRKEGHRRGYRWAVCRAVGQSREIASLALPFLDDHGALLLYKGKPEQRELDALAAFCRGKRLVMESRPVEVPHLVGARTHLIVRRQA